MNRFLVLIPLSIFWVFMPTSTSAQCWASQTSNITSIILGVHFIDTQKGWAVSNAGKILKTVNGGNTWVSQNSNTSNALYCVHFIDAQNGWITGANGMILKTIDGGNNWNQQNSNTTNHLFRVQFLDSQIGWIVGNGSTIFKTVNGGITWTQQSSNTFTGLFCYFVNTQTGWVVGGNGTIAKTSDGGNTWVNQNSNTNNYLYSTYFVDTQTGWIVGENGIILKTINGGSTWETQNSSTTSLLHDVHFVNNQTGWATGNEGIILKTIDGGNSWVSQNSNTNIYLADIFFPNAQTGYIVGTDGTILKTNTFPSVSINAPTQTLCNGSSIQLAANVNETGLQYQWYLNGTNIPNATQSTYSANQAGQYSVKVTPTNGCDNTATLFIKPQVLVDSGLVAYYPFDGDALDYSGNENHGTVNGATLATDRLGNVRKAYSFNGINNYINIGNKVNPAEFTLSAWIQVAANNNSSSFETIISKINGDATFRNFEFRVDPNRQITVHVPNTTDGWVVLTNPTPMNYGQWYFVSVTWDGNIAKLYVNSSLVILRILPRYDRMLGDVLIGARPGYVAINETTSFFNGKMDDIRIYNRALTPAEIQLLYKPAAYNFAQCASDTLKLTTPSVSGVSYTWKKAGTTVAAIKPNATITDNATYNLDISYKGCTFTDTMVVNSLKAKPVVTLNDTSICSGSSAYLQVPTGFSNYQWSVGSSTTATNTITPLSTQSVSATITDANGCTASDTATITVLPASLNCGLVAHYKLDGNARDTSGNGNHGTPIGGVTWTKDRFGNCNSAASFDGQNDYIFAPTSTSLESPLNEITLSGWAYSSELNTSLYGMVCKVEPFTYNLNYRMLVNFDTTMSIGIGTTNGWVDGFFKISNWYQPNKWIHYSTVFRNNEVLFYINGILVGQQVFFGQIKKLTTGFLEIGRDAHGPLEYAKGSFDDIHIYNRALSASEITQLYNQIETIKRPPSAQITNSTPSVCTGNITFLTASPKGNGVQYQWFKDSVLLIGRASDTLQVNATGRYQVRVTDITGCDSLSVATTLTINPSPSVSINSSPLSLCGTKPVTIAVNTSETNLQFQWSKDGQVLTGQTGATLQTTQVGSYSVKVTNSNGCVTTVTKIVGNDVSCRCQDSTALIAFYNASGGATSWRRRDNWLTANPINTWYGVTVNTQGCVTSIAMENNGLKDSLTYQVGNISNLAVLNLNYNQIGGGIPVELSRLSNLQSLELSYNRFSGNIPKQLGNLSALKILNLSGDSLTGGIPKELGDLSNLDFLLLGINPLGGTIPNELGNLSNLTFMYLTLCKLEGGIPTQFGTLRKLINLQLDANNLDSTIPKELGSLTNLEQLGLSNNKLKDSIPSELGNLTKLKKLFLSQNQLTGAIPPSFQNLRNLNSFFFETNKIDKVPNLATLPFLKDSTGNIRGLRSQNNKLTFKDIVPNINLASTATFIYNPQDSIYKDTTINLTTGSTLTIDLAIDGALTTNKYVWFKNGIRFDSSNQNKLILRGVAPCDAATYTVQVTNPTAPLLTLYSRKAKVIVSGSVIPTNTNAAICFGTSYRLPSGKVVNVAGNYADTIRNIRNCDSIIVNIRLTISTKVDSTKQTPVLCLGQTYTLPNGLTVSTATNYRDTVKSLSGCDSLIRVVTVTTGSNPTTSNLNPSICRGQNYTLPNGQIVSPFFTTTYSDTLKNRSGCDSLIRKTVVNVAIPTILSSLNATICRGQSYSLQSGLRVSPIVTTTFGDTVRGRSGCDSLIRSINITVNQPTARPLSNSICSGQNYTLSNGKIVTASGIYQDTLRSTLGCDSIITTTTLTVTPPFEIPVPITICSGQTHRLPNGKTVSIAGVYRDTLKNTQGCNTVNVTTLTVTNITTPRNKTIFEGQKDTLPKGRIVNTEGVYRDSFKTKNGCDSIVITTLTVRKVVIDETCFEELKKTLPDAFSPNDDGVNDIFDPEKYFIPSGCPASLRAEQLVIVSKWGEVIYQAKPYQPWDGTSNGYKKPVATGAYYYVLVFKVNDKEKIVRGVINCFSR